jgi:hypothetical protein
MKMAQKQTGRRGNFRGFPKFSIPPELLVLREVELLEISDRVGMWSRLNSIVPQQRRG